MPSDAVLKQISDLMKDGKVQDAADLLAKVRVDVQAESASAVSPEPPPPRDPQLVIYDLFHGIVSTSVSHRSLNRYSPSLRA